MERTKDWGGAGARACLIECASGGLAATPWHRGTMSRLEQLEKRGLLVNTRCFLRVSHACSQKGAVSSQSDSRKRQELGKTSSSGNKSEGGLA